MNPMTPTSAVPSSSTPGLETPIYSKANESLLQNLLNGSLVLSTILFFLYSYTSYQSANYLSLGLFFIAYGLIFLITFARMIPPRVRVSALTLAFFIIGILEILQSGLTANGLLYFLIATLIFGILEKKNYWIIILVAAAVVISILSYLIQTSIITIGTSIVSNESVLYWVSLIANFLFLTFLVTAPLSLYIHDLHSFISTLVENNHSISDENKGLVQNRIEFENGLDRRRLRLVTTRQISREISQQSDLEKLMHDSVELIRTQLGYHQVAIFLNDERNENSFLKAATGEGSQSLLDRNFRVRIHDVGIISSVIARGEPFFTNDLLEETIQYKSSTLSNSKSELTVPLRVGQQILGALDVQSDQKDAFGDEDIEMLQSIADQLASVFDKTKQIQQLKNSVAKLEENYRSYTQGVWRSHLKGTKEHLNYAYIQNALESEFEPPAISEEALNIGETIIAPADSENNPQKDESIMAVPIILRDQILGVLNIKYRGTDIPNDLAALVGNASDRLALALENARLLEQIQERADREHLIGDISSKLRSATDVDSILRTTVAELGKSLGIDEVRIQLKSAESK